MAMAPGSFTTSQAAQIIHFRGLAATALKAGIVRSDPTGWRFSGSTFRNPALAASAAPLEAMRAAMVAR